VREGQCRGFDSLDYIAAQHRALVTEHETQRITMVQIRDGEGGQGAHTSA
jgi:hypothetical protein